MGEIMQYAENERQVKFGLKNECKSINIVAEIFLQALHKSKEIVFTSFLFIPSDRPIRWSKNTLICRVFLCCKGLWEILGFVSLM